MLEVHVIKEEALVVGRPKGILNGELALEMCEFIEVKEVEMESGFNRYCDMGGLYRIDLSLDEIEYIAKRRREYNPNEVRVKSAFLATNFLAEAIVGLYRLLLRSSRIEVQSFTSVQDAAQWLGVEPRKLAL